MDDDLLPQLSDQKPVLDVPQEMILGIAIGMEDDAEIAARFGFEGERWTKLNNWKPFKDAVAAQRAELEANGVTFRIKAKSMTEDVFEHAYKIAKSNDSTLLQKLEFIKVGAKLGDLEPKNNAQVAAGPGFSITINLGNTPAQKTIDIPAVEEVKQIEMEEAVVEEVVETKKKRKKKAA